MANAFPDAGPFGAITVGLDRLVGAGTVLGGLNAALALFRHEVLQSLFLWQGRNLAQTGWSGVRILVVTLALGAPLCLLAARALRVIEAGEDTARSLGLRPRRWRLAVSVLAVAMASAVTAVIGVFTFLGLIAPLVARLLSRGRAPATDSALTGAGLLALADQLAQRLPGAFPLPLDSMLVLAGSLMLLSLLRRLPFEPTEVGTPAQALRLPRLSPTTLALGATLTLTAALTLGRTPEGGQISVMPMLDWRLPRVMAALTAGMAFGGAGALLQRLTANRLARPELLGISTTASLGLLLWVLFAGSTGRAGLFLATGPGALAGLGLITTVVARRRFSPRHLLLAGLAVTTLFSALLSLLLASGHPMAGQLLGWLSGSTYRAAMADAAPALGLAQLSTGVAMAARSEPCRALLRRSSGGAGWAGDRPWASRRGSAPRHIGQNLRCADAGDPRWPRSGPYRAGRAVTHGNRQSDSRYA
ncbi:MAG: iron chelate uptake ABC transporter family permease subunit [Paracoccaceae bacterium]